VSRETTYLDREATDGDSFGATRREQHMAMKEEIAAWDAKAVEPIEATYARYHAQKDFVSDLIALFSDETCARGATWLLKHCLESGGAGVSAAQSKRVVAQLGALIHWEARLHVLQCLSALTIAPGDAEKVARFIRDGLSDDAKFVRAWSYNGLRELAMQHPAYQKEAHRTLEAAMETEKAASVKVRIRKALEAGF
jgi:hypothetical protein